MWPRTAIKGSNRQSECQPSSELKEGFFISNYQRHAALPVHSLYVGSRDGNAFPDADRRAVTEAVSASFDCFTLVDADGYFKGRSVATLIIKIGTDDTGSVTALANELGRLLDQEAIGLETAGTYRPIAMG